MVHNIYAKLTKDIILPDQYLGFLIFGAQKRRYDFLRVVSNAVNNEFLNTAKACCAAARITAFFPGIRGAAGVTADSYGRFWSVRIIFYIKINSFGRAWLLETFLCFNWLGSATFFVWQFCDGAWKFQKYLAEYFALSDSFAARNAAWTPFLWYETKKSK